MLLFSTDDLIASIADADLLQHLDDDSDGAEDQQIIESVHDSALNFINGYLEQAGTEVPDPVPARLKHTALKYAEYCLLNRRHAQERAAAIYEQWIKPAMAWLSRIASGEELLQPVEDDQTPPGAIVEPAKTTPSGGGLAI